MGILSLLQSKKVDRRHPNHDFSDTDRVLANEVKNLNREIRLLHKRKEVLRLRQVIEELQEDFQGDDDDSRQDDGMDSILKTMALQIMQKNQQIQQQGQASIKQVDLTDEAIKEIIDTQIPKGWQKKAKKMTHLALYEIVKQKFPDLSEDTVNRTIKILKEGL